VFTKIRDENGGAENLAFESGEGGKTDIGCLRKARKFSVLKDFQKIPINNKKI